MKLLVNKKARHQYQIHKTFQAGLVLTGAEVKSLRNKSGSLTGSYIKPINNELFLINAQISPYKFADNIDYDPKRTRKLLMKKKEIFHLETAANKKGWSIIPLSIELVGNRIKLNLGIGKGKKEFEKREVIKKRDIKRDIARTLKHRI